MLRRIAVGALALAACGRLDFQAEQRGAADAPANGDAPTDALVPAWTLVQVVDAQNGVATFTPTGAGDLIVVAMEYTEMTSVMSVSDNAPGASSAYQMVAGSMSTDVNQQAGGLEVWSAASANAGATEVTITWSDGPYFAVAWDVATHGLVASVDDVGETSNQPGSNTASPPSLTTSRPGDFIVAAADVAAINDGVVEGSPFVNDSVANGDCWGHLGSDDAPAGAYQATWMLDQVGTSCTTAVAFSFAP